MIVDGYSNDKYEIQFKQKKLIMMTLTDMYNCIKI